MTNHLELICGGLIIVGYVWSRFSSPGTFAKDACDRSGSATYPMFVASSGAGRFLVAGAFYLVLYLLLLCLLVRAADYLWLQLPAYITAPEISGTCELAGVNAITVALFLTMFWSRLPGIGRLDAALFRGLYYWAARSQVTVLRGSTQEARLPAGNATLCLLEESAAGDRGYSQAAGRPGQVAGKRWLGVVQRILEV